MGVYIKGMEMPENCALCPVWDAGNCLVATEAIICEYTKRPSDCPLVPVPPHGRCIDADALVDKHFGKEFLSRVMTADEDDLGTALVNVPLVINNAPTIIEAEED